MVLLVIFKGVGPAPALSIFGAVLGKRLGPRAFPTTTHPAIIAGRLNSPGWRMVRPPSLAVSRAFPTRSSIKHAATRLTAGFEYTGPPLDRAIAERLLRDRKADHVL